MKAIDFIESEFQPGRNILISGLRGGGKSSLAVSCAERWLKNKDTDQERWCVMNIPMVKRDADGKEHLTVAFDHVRCVSDVESLFIAICNIMENAKDYDKLRILIVIDEAQNCLSGSGSGTSKIQDFTRILAITRKLGQATMVCVTPVEKNCLPRVRQFVAEGGYKSASWFKTDKKIFKDKDPRSVVWVRHYGTKWNPIVINQTSWCKPDSPIHYDHLGISALALERPKFTVPNCVDAISGVMSSEVPSVLRKYLDSIGSDDISEDGTPIPKVQTNAYDLAMSIMFALRPFCTVEEIALACGVNYNSLRSRMASWEKDGGIRMDGDLLAPKTLKKYPCTNKE